MTTAYNNLLASPFVLFTALATTSVLTLAFLLKLWNIQPWITHHKMASKISDRVYEYCTSGSSVTTEYAAALESNPKATPGQASKKLFGQHTNVVSRPRKEREPANEADLERAYKCGKWGEDRGGRRPSELFLRIFHDALCALEDDPLMGCVSPSLMGSCGTIPLTIISTLPDITRHMSNLIARAETEVFLATNYWMNSDASAFITQGLRELSRRAVARGKKVVVKIIYDRGHIKQVIDHHTFVDAAEYTAGKIGLPPPAELPNVDLQVMNYHRVILGTFHPKFMVVDRKMAIIQSNNIQDNDNLEMMTHVEGPIVDAFYDLALISWEKAMDPPLPLLKQPAAGSKIPCFEPETLNSLKAIAKKLKTANNFVQPGEVNPPEHLVDDPHYDTDISGEINRMQCAWTPSEDQSRMELVGMHLNRATHLDIKSTAPECSEGEEMIPYIPTPNEELFPIAMVGRKPWGAPNHSCVVAPQNEAWLSGLRNAKSEVFIQSPDLNAEPLLPAILEAVRRGVKVTYFVCLGYNDSGELLPFQGGTNEMVAHKLYTQLDESDRKNLVVCYYVGKDQILPIHNRFKKRSCHIKLMIVDRRIGIQGNGNQDTQSWYHSQEANIMIDSELVCEAWLDGIARNQNSMLYGRASPEDGLWRDAQGKQAEGAIGANPGRFAWAKGAWGAVERVRGVGGF